MTPCRPSTQLLASRRRRAPLRAAPGPAAAPPQLFFARLPTPLRPPRPPPPPKQGKASEALRGAPYLVPLEEISRRAAEAWDRGATEVWRQTAARGGGWGSGAPEGSAAPGPRLIPLPRTTLAPPPPLLLLTPPP
jgi:hypothetical protein